MQKIEIQSIDLVTNANEEGSFMKYNSYRWENTIDDGNQKKSHLSQNTVIFPQPAISNLKSSIQFQMAEQFKDTYDTSKNSQCFCQCHNKKIQSISISQLKSAFHSLSLELSNLKRHKQEVMNQVELLLGNFYLIIQLASENIVKYVKESLSKINTNLQSKIKKMQLKLKQKMEQTLTFEVSKISYLEKQVKHSENVIYKLKKQSAELRMQVKQYQDIYKQIQPEKHDYGRPTQVSKLKILKNYKSLSKFQKNSQAQAAINQKHKKHFLPMKQQFPKSIIPQKRVTQLSTLHNHIKNMQLQLRKEIESIVQLQK